MRVFTTKHHFTSSLRIDEPELTRQRVVPRPRPTADRQTGMPGMTEAADLYYPRRARGLGYQHFASLAEALDHALDVLTPSQRGGCVIQVGERRLETRDVTLLLEARRQETAGDSES